MVKYGKYCDWYKCKDGSVELPIVGDYTDLFENENELCVVEWGDEIPYLMNKNEIFNILHTNEINGHYFVLKNCIEVIFNGDIEYIICPLNAEEKIHKDFKEIQDFLSQQKF